MFEAFQNGIHQIVEAVQKKYDGFTDSVDKLNQDILEIRDVFVGIKGSSCVEHNCALFGCFVET